MPVNNRELLDGWMRLFPRAKLNTKPRPVSFSNGPIRFAMSYGMSDNEMKKAWARLSKTTKGR